MDQLHSTWEAILSRVSRLVNSQSFQTWFKPTRLVKYEAGHIVIEGPNPFFVDWLAEHHKDKIKAAARETLGEDVTVEFTAPTTQKRSEERKIEKAVRGIVVKESVTLPNRVHLNARYTFSEFIVGNSNRLAHAAAQAVAEHPARAYNPLFIYGGVGLGKTHLIQAIGHQIMLNHQEMRISYTTAETFMNELIQAIRSGVTLEFKEKYRSIDVLLIDDIQFLSGKESTQEEFFFTFNALHEANKQIVVTSDRPPKEIPTLQERLKSRFEWGLITDIQPPDLETRIAILKKKVEKENIQIPESVIQLIAQNIKSNIRELEGSLIKLLACASLTRQEINTDMAMGVLRDIIKDNAPPRITVQNIQKAVAQHFDIPFESLKAKTRISRVVTARQVAIFLSRELTDLPLAQIGKRFGGRDHSTILHSFKKVSRLIETDLAMKKRVEAIKEQLLS
ncbi:chromosomal replication initiator protein DnaA [bacterium]|nr:MAG: chromosomal replication initiator protein DnaA [bacterium]